MKTREWMGQCRPPYSVFWRDHAEFKVWGGQTFADFSFESGLRIDDSKVVEDQLLKEFLEPDLVIWAIQANCPARAPYMALLTRLALSALHRNGGAQLWSLP